MHFWLISIGHAYRRGYFLHCRTKPAKQETSYRYTRRTIINHSSCSMLVQIGRVVAQNA
jgi:hypothetical protein